MSHFGSARDTWYGTVNVMKRDFDCRTPGQDMDRTSVAAEDQSTTLDHRLESVQITAARQVSTIPNVLLFANSTEALLNFMECGEFGCELVSKQDS